MDDILDALAADKCSVDDTASRCHEDVQSLFSVQLRFANADKEMKHIFGVGRGCSLAGDTVAFCAVC